ARSLSTPPPRPPLFPYTTLFRSFFAILRWRWDAPWEQALAMLAAWASFQMFATLLTHATARAEAMAGALRASNADLLATRELLRSEERSCRDTVYRSAFDEC